MITDLDLLRAQRDVIEELRRECDRLHAECGRLGRVNVELAGGLRLFVEAVRDGGDRRLAVVEADTVARLLLEPRGV